MNTFKIIIQKIINKVDTIYDIDHENNSFNFWSKIYKNDELKDLNYSYKYFYYIFMGLHESKFEFLHKIVSNMFLNEIDKEKILDIFFKVQKVYHAFSRLVRVYKFKKSELQVNHDLYLNPITTQKYITILQNGKKYMFTATDLINIVNTALSNAPHFFVEPLVAKNPYNNIPFDKSTLYNIYFFLRKTDYKMPVLIEKYFLSNFDITLFYFENESIIRDIAIDNFVFKSDTKVLYPSVINMIQKYDTKNILTISEEFPKDKLVNIMRPYLHLYYITKYSFMFNKKENAYAELTYKFRQFIKFNHKFGRKYIMNNPFTKKSDTSFDEKHINFYNIKTRNYKNSHLLLNMDSEYNNNYDSESDDDLSMFNMAPILSNTASAAASYVPPFGSIISSFNGEFDRTVISFDTSNTTASLHYSSWYYTNDNQETENNEETENIIISEQSIIDDMQDYMISESETIIVSDSDTDTDDEIVIEADDDTSVD
jgi:hypothetical protein